MEVQTIQIQNVSFEQMVQAIATEVGKMINTKTQTATTDILKIQDAMKFLGCERTTLKKLVKNGSIKAYGINKTTYFKKQELINALVEKKIAR